MRGRATNTHSPVAIKKIPNAFADALVFIGLFGIAHIISVWL